VGKCPSATSLEVRLKSSDGTTCPAWQTPPLHFCQSSRGFLRVAQERTGLLVEAGQGVYRFSHLTFQEYLAAVEIAESDDCITYTLRHTADAFWRETILLEAGYLSTKNRIKTTRLIQAIADFPIEPEPFHNLVLAAECVRGVGPTRIEGDLAAALTNRLCQELEKPLPNLEEERGWLAHLFRGKQTSPAEQRKAVLLRRVSAATALSRIGSESFGTSSQYWSQPHGEPEWMTIPAGQFWWAVKNLLGRDRFIVSSCRSFVSHVRW
jgi:hypothetical protein